MPGSVLVIGGGGREHAIVRQLAASPLRPEIHVAPGNPGTAALARNVALDVADPAALVRYCQDEGIELVIVGPEEPLIAGLADHLRHGGVAVFGPGALGARLEGDKEFAKEVLQAAGVPTPRFHAFSTTEAALSYLDTMDLPVVVKACGAAQGKGVAVCATREEAEAFVRDCLDGQRFGASGLRILLEECIRGPELSVLVVTDGQDHCLLAPSRDHKRIGEGDTGPNTGGMGAFAPVALPAALRAEIDARVVLPVLAELRRRDIPYRGVLYAGLMLTATGPQVLEFNCRFGDPETQVVLPLLRGDLYELCAATAAGELGAFLEHFPAGDDDPSDWAGAGLSEWRRHCVVVVGAADGYPGRSLSGRVVELPPDREGAWIIHAGTRLADGVLKSAGGRVIGAVGLAADAEGARSLAYDLLGGVHFEGLTYRRDIAVRKD